MNATLGAANKTAGSLGNATNEAMNAAIGAANKTAGSLGNATNEAMNATMGARQCNLKRIKLSS